jgi:hypothetical protein
VAVNCSVPLSPKETPLGATVIDSRIAGCTVRSVDPTTGPKAALMVVDPGARAVAVPVLLLMVATVVVEELQVMATLAGVLSV